ncbi:MAG: type II secretion system protein [Phycisphaerales bacterium]|nr:MAG: type II secretion system protein [Phycisphaerales bacterium]
MAMDKSKRDRSGGFTLVELLVVIAIIGILVSLLVPAISRIRDKAKEAKTAAQFSSLEAGIEAYRSDAVAGGALPPSRSDYANDRQMIANPLADQPTPDMKVAGAHLLCMAMVGADRLGTPGFKDFNRDGIWSNDTHNGAGGAYEIDQSTGEVLRARYGGAGYVSDQMREQIRTLQELLDKNVIVLDQSGLTAAIQTVETAELPLFVDAWDRPILYYRANPGAKRMVTDPTGPPGIYNQIDNGIVTGSDAAGVYSSSGIDFGAGKVDPSSGTSPLHKIVKVTGAIPELIPTFTDGVNDILTLQPYDNSFARFILDPTLKARNTPVRRDSYLLISAGSDAIYGTKDDLTNWTREE